MISICPRSSSFRLYGGWPPLSPSGKHLRSLLYAMQKPICYSSGALPSHLACPSLTTMPSSRERTRGLIKNKGDLFFFWHVKIFHFFFSPRLFLIHTSMKNGLNGLFFPASFCSPFLLWVAVYNKAFYIIWIWHNPFWHKDLVRPLIFARVNNFHYHEYLNVSLLE